MTCADARAALLDADLDALRPGAAGPLGQHLAGCAACRAAADRILAGTAALAAARARAPGRPSAAVAEAARVAGARLRVRRRRIRVLVPLLAAACLALFFVRHVPSGPGDGRPPAAAPAALPPLVEGGAHTVAVIATTRPDVTVVWQF
jgi:predicted anti-sigma-YlaC factor YlaD